MPRHGTIEVFISPTIDDPFEVAGTLVHELLHAAVGPEHGHRGPFKRAMKQVGLVGPARSSRPGDELAAFIRGSMLPQLGDYPHKRIDWLAADMKSQKGRLFKATCADCGYAEWTTRKWIKAAVPICPQPDCPSFTKPMIVEFRGL